MLLERTALAAGLMLVACGQSDVPHVAADMGGRVDGDVPRDGAASTDLAAPGNLVNGTFGGAAFGTVQTAWVIGAPDSDSTTVVYLFNRKVDCHDAKIRFGTMGWDVNLADKTQFLEIKLVGPTPAITPPTAPGDFKVTRSVSPGPGEASVNHSLSHVAAASTEAGASAGTVTLLSISDQTSATGTFTLHFGNDTLQGGFDAGFCDIGVEP